LVGAKVSLSLNKRQLSDFFQGVVNDGTFNTAVGFKSTRLLVTTVPMKDDDIIALEKEHIQFYSVTTDCSCSLERGNGVFGFTVDGTAMANNRWAIVRLDFTVLRLDILWNKSK
jgi:hypothetical protein